MGRPPGYQWHPLGYSEDPVPGNTQQISAEVQRLSSVGKTINGQIAALHKISADGTEVGEHAEEIRSAASGLADKLQKVATRYERVTSALNGWIPELEQAQSMSIRALNQAEGPYAKIHQTVALPSGDNLTAQQKQQISDYHTAINKAQGELDEAKKLLNSAIQLRDSKGSYYANKIRDASHDSLKDSWWDKFKDAIGSISWLLKDICTVLEIAAAVLAIIALFATGAGFLIAAFLLTAGALLLRTLLAATGNGSWIDVALDAFALLTLGVSGGITGAGGLVARAGSTLGRAVEVGDEIVQGARDASFAGKVFGALTKSSDVLSNVADWMGKVKFLSPISRALGRGADFADGLADFVDDYQDIVRPLASSMVKDVEQESALARAAAGGEDLGNYISRMSVLRNAFSDSTKIMDLGKVFDSQVNVARTTILSSAAINLGTSVVLPGIPVFGPNDWEISAWKNDWFDKAEEVTTAPIENVATGAWHLATSPFR